MFGFQFHINSKIIISITIWEMKGRDRKKLIRDLRMAWSHVSHEFVQINTCPFYYWGGNVNISIQLGWGLGLWLWGLWAGYRIHGVPIICYSTRILILIICCRTGHPPLTHVTLRNKRSVQLDKKKGEIITLASVFFPFYRRLRVIIINTMI